MATTPVEIQKAQPVAETGPKTVVTKTGNGTVGPQVTVHEVSASKASENGVVTVTTTAVSSASSMSSSDTLTRTTTNGSGVQPDSRVAEVVHFVKGLFSKLGPYEVGLLRQADLAPYLQYIADERLIHMPRKGSDWDRVLRTAQFFGLQIWRFGERVGQFAPESRQAAAAALASCQMLLEIGHRQAGALLPAFMTLYELGLLVPQVTQIPGIFASTKEVKADISRLYSALVGLAGSVSVHYRNQLFNLGTQKTAAAHQVTLNLNDLFGNDIDAIWASKTALYDRIWQQSLGKRASAHGLDVATLRRHLDDAPAEPFRLALYAELAEDLERAEDTCEWVKSDLVEFFKSGDKMLAVAGGPGSGKTVLADWIEERLQRPLNNTTYSVLLYTFPSDDHAGATVLAFLKGLLAQLLERSVGNAALYESLAAAFVQGEANGPKLEEALWKALQIGLNTFKKSEEPIVLLLDGFEEAAGGAPSAIAALFQQLQKYVLGVKNVRTIVFSRYEHKFPGHAGVRHRAITEADVAQDIRSFLRQTLARSALFMALPPAQRETVVEGLARKAKGSFLWARLAGSYLLRFYGAVSAAGAAGAAGAKQPTAAALVEAANALSADVGDIVLATVGQLDLPKHHELRHLLSFLLVSDAPLATEDLAMILAVDVEAQTLREPVAVAQLVARGVPDLVLVRDGRVRFKSSLVRSALHKHLGGKASGLPAAAEAHHQLVLRLLLYARLSLRRGGGGGGLLLSDPTMDELDDAAAARLQAGHPLLGFVLAHWLYHFEASTQFRGGGGSNNNNNSSLALSKDFKAVFPDAVAFALLERQVWARRADLVARLTLTLRIREAVFTEQHASVLQTLVLLGHVYRQQGALAESARCYYRATVLGQTVLSSRFSALVVACADAFLAVTDGMAFASRTELVTYRETLLQLQIDVSRARFGEHSEAVEGWLRKLAALYVAIREEHRTVAVYRSIYELIRARDGKDSREAVQLQQFFGGLDVTLEGEGGEGEGEKEEEEEQATRGGGGAVQKRQVVVGYGELLLDTAQDLEVTDVKLYLALMLRVAASYEAEGRGAWAERVYVGLWRRVSGLTRASSSKTAASVDVDAAKLRVALAYARFLRTARRDAEATNVLVVVWTEYEHAALASEEAVLSLRAVGELLRSLGAVDVASRIFGAVWGWFKTQGRSASDAEASRTMVLITEVVREITTTTMTRKTTVTTTTTTTTTATTTETVRDVYETHYERCRKAGGQADATFFAAARAHVDWLVALEQWTAAEAAVRQALALSWKAVLAGGESSKLALALATTEETAARETVGLALRLAACHRQQRRVDEAEQVYRRVYGAVAASGRSPEHALFQEALGALRGFYEAFHRHEQLVALQAGVVEACRRTLGAGHRLTVEALYALAAEYELLGRDKEAAAQHGEIVAVLNKGRTHCHKDAFRAAVALVGVYARAARWAELQALGAVLWETFVQHHGAFAAEFTAEVVALVYDQYSYALEHHGKASAQVLYEVAASYRATATAVFGAAAAVVQTATLALARASERSEAHQHEAVALYEEMLRTTTATTTSMTTTTTTTVEIERTVRTVTQRLSTLYVRILSSGGGGGGGKAGSSKAVAGVRAERAVAVALEAYAQVKAEHGLWHAETLARLRDVVALYRAEDSKGTTGSKGTAQAAAVLQTAVVEVLRTQTVSAQLFAAATGLARVYASGGAGLAAAGRALLHHLRHLLVFGDDGLPAGVVPAGTAAIELHLGTASRRHVVFLFVAAFERQLASGGGEGQKAVSAATFSELLSSLLYEALLYEEYREALAGVVEDDKKGGGGSGGDMEAALVAGARLRGFWAEAKRTELVAVLDGRLFPVFRARYGSIVAAAAAPTTDDDVRRFYAALLAELGRERAEQARQARHFAVQACRAGLAAVRSLLEAGALGAALGVGRFAFAFAAQQDHYRSTSAGIAYGYQLAALLALVDVKVPAGDDSGSAGAQVRAELLALSRTVTAAVFGVLAAEEVDVAGALTVADVGGLVRLLGAQGDCGRLEALLLPLWQSREVRRRWGAATVLSLGVALVHAYAGQAPAQLDRAVDLADRLWYNLRRSRGWLDADAVAASQLLASLYAEAGRPADAMAVYEQVLQQIAAAGRRAASRGSDGGAAAAAAATEDADGDRGLLAAQARQHLALLGAAHGRLGRWTRPKKEVHELYDHLREGLGLQGQLPASFDKWAAAAEKDSALSGLRYAAPAVWTIAVR